LPGGIARTKDLITWERLDLKTACFSSNVVLHLNLSTASMPSTLPPGSVHRGGQRRRHWLYLCDDITHAVIQSETIIDPRIPPIKERPRTARAPAGDAAG
jgi:hypothetical protein